MGFAGQVQVSSRYSQPLIPVGLLNDAVGSLRVHSFRMVSEHVHRVARRAKQINFGTGGLWDDTAQGCVRYRESCET